MKKWFPFPNKALQTMNICILVPVYNESLNITGVIKKLKARSLPVIVVDDGSTDNSAQLAVDAGAVVLRNPQRTGKGTSLQKGFDYIRRQEYDGIIMMDGDGQHDVEDLDQFLKLIKAKNPHIIVGNRMSDPKGMPALRQNTNRLMSGMISWACRQNIPDTQCGYRYLSMHALRNLQFTSSDFEIETEILVEAAKKKWPIYSVPVKTIYGEEKSHVHPVKDTVRFISYFIKAVAVRFQQDKR